jgi:hypothetical protein
LLVERVVEVPRDAHVDERAGQQEHHRHRERKDEREPGPDR